MKKLLIHLTVTLSLLFGFSTYVNAESSSSQVLVSMNEDEIDRPEEDPRGYRKPHYPVICTIDFTTYSLVSYY